MRDTFPGVSATMQVMAAAKGRYARAVTVVFERPPGT